MLDTDDQIDIKIGGADDFRFTANTFTALAGSSIVTPTLNVTSSATISGGAINLAAIDIDGGTDIGAAIVDADLLIIDDGAGGTNRKVAASRLKTFIGSDTGGFAITNLDIDGGTDIGAAIVDADLFIIDDGAGGTNRKTAASRLLTYAMAGTLSEAAQTNITTLGTLSTLTIDNVIINGSTIGHTGDTDLITVASGVVTVAGEISVTTLDIGGTNVTSTAAELNLLDDKDATFLAGPGKLEGTNFTDSLIIGHATTGTLNAAEQNLGVGIRPLEDLTSGDRNTAIGYSAGANINTGGYNTAVGNDALIGLTTASYNTAIGQDTLRQCNSNDNTAIGKEALKLVNTGVRSIG